MSRTTDEDALFLKKTFDEFKTLPEGTAIEHPGELIRTPYVLSSTLIKITGACGVISFTRRSLKHLAEKGIKGEKLLKAIPLVLAFPEEIRRGDADMRFLISKIVYAKGLPQAVVLETLVKNNVIVITSFTANKKYLSNFELLWRAENSPHG